MGSGHWKEPPWTPRKDRPLNHGGLPGGILIHTAEDFIKQLPSHLSFGPMNVAKKHRHMTQTTSNG